MRDSGFLPTPTLNLPGLLPTPTPTQTSEPTLAPARGVCGAVPRGWLIYTVQAGDTLFAIARAVNTTVLDLLRANCLSDADSITPRSQIYVPGLPQNPLATGLPPEISGEACFDTQRAAIIGPSAGQPVSGLLTIVGTATLPDFGYYRLDMRAFDAAGYTFVSRFAAPVSEGILGQIDTSQYANGLYWLRLSVVNAQGSIPFGALCSVLVYFDN